MSKWLKHCRSRLKKELECVKEKRPQFPELSTQADAHQKVRDIHVKGAPGTKIESMKVLYTCIVLYCIYVITLILVLLYFLCYYYYIIIMCIVDRKLLHMTLT